MRIKCQCRFSNCKQDVDQDNGHLLVLVLKRSGLLSVKIVHKENGTIWRKGCCWNSQKVIVQFSVLQVHYPEVNSEAKDMINCLYILLQNKKQLKLFFAESGLVTGLATKCCPLVPLPSCAFLALSTLLQSARSHLSTPPGPLHPLPRPLRLPVLRRPRPTPTMTGTLSLTHMASPRRLVAPRPPSPNRPTPLELVGVLAASDTVTSAKPPSAPCGGKFDMLSPVFCAFSVGVASLAVGFVLGTCTLLRVMEKCWRMWSFPAVPAQDVGFFWRCWRWLWRGRQLGDSEDAEKPNKCCYVPRKWLCEVEFIMVVILTGEGSSQVQDSLLLDVTLLSMGLESAVMTKLIERNITNHTQRDTNVHDTR